MEKDSTDILMGLQPLHHPEAVPFWPPAPGWYVIGVLCLVLLAWGVIAWIRQIKAQQYRKVAVSLLRELDRKITVIQAKETLSTINNILKRVAMQTFPREKVASLSGKEWLFFLTKTGVSTDFTNAPGSFLAEGLYEKNTTDISSEQLIGLLRLAETWIVKHR